jgi:hypothetical protein
MSLRRAIVCAALLLQTVSASDALAANRSGRSGGASRWGGHQWHGGHRHFHSSFFIGVPLYGSYWGPYWYPPPLPYYPLAVPLELEQYAVPLQSGFWYYCHSAGAYYPGVAECPEGWEQVAPQSAEPR